MGLEMSPLRGEGLRRSSSLGVEFEMKAGLA